MRVVGASEASGRGGRAEGRGPLPLASEDAARDALFATSSGGDARAPGSSSWAPDASYDAATAGRHAKRSEKGIEEGLALGVRRLARSKEVLSEAGHAAIEANTAGEEVLAALRGQRERLADAGDALAALDPSVEANETLVRNMRSWTRLGARPRRTPWG